MLVYIVIRKIKMIICKCYVVPLLYFLKYLIPISRTKLAFVFDTRNLHDGLGAQMQRFFSVYSLAQFLNVNFYSDLVRNISIHPFDGIYSKTDYEVFLRKVNVFLKIDVFAIPIKFFISRSDINEVRVEKLSISRLLHLIFLGMGSDTYIFIENTYPIIDLMPSLYKYASIEFGQHSKFGKKQGIALHYRVGAGGNSIYPGQKIPRETDSSRFVSILTSISPKLTLNIFTDSPSNDVDFKVPSWQDSYWRGTPRYKNGVISIKGLDVEKLFSNTNSNIKIHIGGDPLDTIFEMAQYKILIASKSSMSYVAGILGENDQVYLPRDFWHTKLPKWKSF